MGRSNQFLPRQVAAGLLIAAGAGYVLAVKLTREGGDVLAPAWLAGVLPNLVCAAVVPLAPFLSPRNMRGRDAAAMVLFTAAGLGLYEVAQLWLPRRTFDWLDLAATAAGAAMALALAAGLMRLPIRTGTATARKTGTPWPI